MKQAIARVISAIIRLNEKGNSNVLSTTQGRNVLETEVPNIGLY